MALLFLDKTLTEKNHEISFLQVNYHAQHYHLTPFTVINIMYSFNKTQVRILSMDSIKGLYKCHLGLVIIKAIIITFNLVNKTS